MRAMTTGEMAITVDVSSLKQKLVQNRREHERIYNEAVVAYNKKAAQELGRRLEETRDTSTPVNLAFALAVPEEHLADFDQAIEMLSWHQDKEIALTHRDFRRYVQNEWDWAWTFAANTSSYVGA